MQRSSKSGETSLARYDIIVKTFWGLPSCFLVWIENSRSQHQTSTTFSELVREDGSTLLLPRSPARFLTSTPKPRAEGSSPSAPDNPLVPRPRENRMAWGFFVPMLVRTRSTNSRLMLHPVLPPRIWPQLAFTAVFLSSTQNAPGFALLGLFRVRFSLFRCFWGAKFPG